MDHWTIFGSFVSWLQKKRIQVLLTRRYRLNTFFCRTRNKWTFLFFFFFRVLFSDAWRGRCIAINTAQYCSRAVVTCTRSSAFDGKHPTFRRITRRRYVILYTLANRICGNCTVIDEIYRLAAEYRAHGPSRGLTLLCWWACHKRHLGHCYSALYFLFIYYKLRSPT